MIQFKFASVWNETHPVNYVQSQYHAVVFCDMPGLINRLDNIRVGIPFSCVEVTV